MKIGVLIKIVILCAVCFAVLLASVIFNAFNSANAMPFYNLQPKNLVERASFTTYYKGSSEERKSNIKKACQSLNNTFVDIDGEFSFNYTVGERTESRGYKKAKIINKGRFLDGVGGGVCQVSTTLYNAVLIADLKITEYHPHSLKVSYVLPSFDAMVNYYGNADLRFVNNTHNPLIINSFCDDEKITVKIWGEPIDYKCYRISKTIGEITAEKEQVIVDEKGEYKDLLKGERRVLSYSQNGLISEGYIVKVNKLGKKTTIKIRNDTYSPINGIIIEGTNKEEVIKNPA